MQTVFIKFLTEADRAKGFFELAKRSGISSLPGQVYQVPLAALPILDETHIDYRRATDAEGQIATGLISVYQAMVGGWEIRLTGCAVPPGEAL